MTGGILADSMGFQKTFLVGAPIIAMSMALLTFAVKETAGAEAAAEG